MKKNRFRSLIVIVILSLFAVSASASCPDIYGTYCNYLYCWNVYDLPSTCYSVSGSATKVTTACGNGGFDFGSGTGQATKSFTLTSSDPILNPSKWNIGGNVHFNSPGGTSADRVEIDINVYHPNTGTWSYYTNFYWSGVNGNFGCHLTNSFFTANTGDVIQIVITGTNSGSATIQVDAPILTNNSN